MNTQPQYGAATRPLAFLGCLILGSAIGPAPVPRTDSVGATKQITTFTAGGATNSETYTVTFTSSTPGSVGDSIAITTAALDGSATQAELVSALQAAMYDSPAFMRYVDSITTGATTVVVTLKTGQSGTYALTDNPNTDLSQAATQAQADFQAYTFGRAVEVLGPDSGAVDNQRIRPLQASDLRGPRGHRHGHDRRQRLETRSRCFSTPRSVGSRRSGRSRSIRPPPRAPRSTPR
jgi:hypothetical protein